MPLSTSSSGDEIFLDFDENVSEGLDKIQASSKKAAAQLLKDFEKAEKARTRAQERSVKEAISLVQSETRMKMKEFAKQERAAKEAAKQNKAFFRSLGGIGFSIISLNQALEIFNKIKTVVSDLITSNMEFRFSWDPVRTAIEKVGEQTDRTKGLVGDMFTPLILGIERSDLIGKLNEFLEKNRELTQTKAVEWAASFAKTLAAIAFTAADSASQIDFLITVLVNQFNIGMQRIIPAIGKLQEHARDRIIGRLSKEIDDARADLIDVMVDRAKIYAMLMEGIGEAEAFAASMIGKTGELSKEKTKEIEERIKKERDWEAQLETDLALAAERAHKAALALDEKAFRDKINMIRREARDIKKIKEETRAADEKNAKAAEDFARKQHMLRLAKARQELARTTQVAATLGSTMRGVWDAANDRLATTEQKLLRIIPLIIKASLQLATMAIPGVGPFAALIGGLFHTGKQPGTFKPNRGPDKWHTGKGPGLTPNEKFSIIRKDEAVLSPNLTAMLARALGAGSNAPQPAPAMAGGPGRFVPMTRSQLSRWQRETGLPTQARSERLGLKRRGT